MQHTITSFAKRILLISTLIGGLIYSATAQTPLAIRNNIPYITAQNDTLVSGWSGGINAPIWGQLSLNGDTFPDMVFFDSYDNVFVPMLNQGGAKPAYQYAPQYYDAFKDCNCKDWARFIDYNQDGHVDMFCGDGLSNGRISQYVNRPNNGEARFELVVQRIEFDFNAVKLWINSVNSHLPDFADMDGDGDIDFVTWENPFFGNSMLYFKNVSQENYGRPDTVHYIQESTCWAHIGESSASGLPTLYDTAFCPLVNFSPVANGCDMTNKPKVPRDSLNGDPKNGGSTTLLLDMDANQVQDLLLGDLGTDKIVYLHNCGTPEYAFMDDFTDSFPSNDPVLLTQTPALTYADLNGDGKRDLLVGVYETAGNRTIMENVNATKWYENTGDDDRPIFTFRQKGFLAQDMMDRGRNSYPCPFDYNADGLMDIIMGTGGIYDGSDSSFQQRLVLFENVGNADRPAFKLVDDDYLGTSANPFSFPAPAMGDMDNDGDLDLLIGQENGEVALYENTAGVMQPAQFTLLARAYAGIDPGTHSVPAAYDADKDGDQDLIVGNSSGKISFYLNNGNGTFSMTTNSWGSLHVKDRFGRLQGARSAPFLFNFDSDPELEVIVGSEDGYAEVYDLVEKAFTDSLPSLGQLLGQKFSENTAPVAVVLDSTERLTYLIGGDRGGLMMANHLPYDTVVVEQRPTSIAKPLPPSWEIQVFPNPTTGEVNITRAGQVGELHVAVWDLMGKQVLPARALPMGRTQLDLRSFPQGVYVLQVEGGGQMRSFRVIRIAP